MTLARCQASTVPQAAGLRPRSSRAPLVLDASSPPPSSSRLLLRSSIAAYGEGLQRTYLSPDHLVPHFLRLAVETSESIAAHVDTSSDALNTQVAASGASTRRSLRSLQLSGQLVSAGGQLGDRTPNGAKDKELKKLRAEIAKLRKDKG
ncbi:hypothetical protein NFJ02_08g136330 [Pycnococcus provasolii]